MFALVTRVALGGDFQESTHRVAFEAPDRTAGL